jgi:hypothetical protein
MPLLERDPKPRAKGVHMEKTLSAYREFGPKHYRETSGL